MAPNKKKKKAASNTSRGYATTSTPSKIDKKADIVEASESESVIPTSSSAETPESTSQAANETRSANEGNKLSAEEFEKQLEEFELRGLVDKYGQKIKRDSARQVSKLETDRRVLRGQAEDLTITQWLPPELMEQILELTKSELMNSTYYTETDPPKASTLSEEDTSIKFWTLQQALLALGFPEQQVKQVLRQLLEDSSMLSHASISRSKDALWGLEESLDWLAIKCEQTQLPAYNHRLKRTTSTFLPPYFQADTPTGTPEASGRSTPATVNSTQSSQLGPRDSSQGSLINGSEHDDLPDSNPESDLEPEELLSGYLEIKSRLYEIRPELVPNISSKSRKAKSAKSAVPFDHAKTAPKVVKLQRKLKKIESDMLFDQYSADQKWFDMRNNLAQMDAARRKLLLDEPAQSPPNDLDVEGSNNQSVSAAVSQAATEAGAALPAASDDDEDDEITLGEIFASLPQEDTDPATGATNMVIKSPDGENIKIRDFGKWTGMSPRRVLEEACRARNTKVRLSYSILSSSSYSNRHSVTIKWTKAQDIVLSAQLSRLSFTSDQRTTSVSMTSISTPDAAQSEAYVSTAALFLIFASSPKEEKVYLRLPATWRDLWREFAVTRQEQMDQIDRDTLRELRDMIREKRDRDEEDGIILANGFRKRSATANGKEGIEGSPEDYDTHQIIDVEDLSVLWTQKSSTPSYQHMLRVRMSLPMWSFKNEVLTTIEHNQITIICGETGCGKSTQVPSFLLEYNLSQGKACNVYCTEPRRISAISLARRVSEELGERRNDLGTSRSMVGYAIRLESNITNQTKLVYATTGIVMRMLERSNGLGDITHLVLDEVHERSIDSDFLLIILRKLVLRCPDLKVILMSATVDAQRFSSYLNGAPILTVPGRTFPVETKFLEDAVELTGYSIDSARQQKNVQINLDDADAEDSSDQNLKTRFVDDLRAYSSKTRNTLAQFDEYRIDYGLVVALIEKIATDYCYDQYSKAILIFLPGIAEIRQLNDMLVGHPSLSHGWYIYPLHSTIASEEQERAFLVPPEGTRKIIIATNIAETGITIPDITCVIDVGKHKEMRFDERRQLSRLIESFISRANAKQRRGRAGRVQNGLCFHLFTKARHDRLMAEQQTPEMLRLSLQDLVLRVKICNLGNIEQTLLEALDPPLPKNIRRAIDALVDVKALTASEELTPLGRQLAKLPLDVFLGKLILHGTIFRCLDAAVTIAAILSSKSPFSAPMGARKQADVARLGFKKGDSDLLTTYNAYCAWRRVCNSPGASEYQFCGKNFLSSQNLSNIEDLKCQLLVSLADSGLLVLDEAGKSSLIKARFSSRHRHFFIPSNSIDTNSGNDLIVNSIIAWSFYPKLLIRDGKGWRNVANNQSVSLHPTSVNKGSVTPMWLSFYHIMQSSNKFYNAHETSTVEDLAICLSCGDAEFRIFAGVVVLDGNRLRFSVSDWKTMVVLKALRTHLRDITSQLFREPGKPLLAHQQKWFDIWQHMFSRMFNTKR
ncbi:MAG: hypothetical protein M1827_005621 [Pycnora praestabilis]|nr:MAG: hypothetical protein M1827_005621 [Pycnora praestabilis]